MDEIEKKLIEQGWKKEVYNGAVIFTQAAPVVTFPTTPKNQKRAPLPKKLGLWKSLFKLISRRLHLLLFFVFKTVAVEAGNFYFSLGRGFYRLQGGVEVCGRLKLTARKRRRGTSTLLWQRFLAPQAGVEVIF